MAAYVQGRRTGHHLELRYDQYVKELSGDQFVNNWVKEEVEAVKINIGLLEFEWSVRCESNEDVKILSTALSLAQQWKIHTLYLPDDMREDGWRALTNVVGSGKVVDLHVSKEALSAADDQQIDALKQATKNFWVDGELQNRRETSCCQLC